MENQSSIVRIQRDIKLLNSDCPENIFFHYDESNIYHLDVVFIGPIDTPYENGFFHFKINFKKTYPWDPPTVTFLTTDCGKVSFNPHLYACGKVCLSILGTWNGPPWSPALTIESLLVSIQSIMCENPLCFDSEDIKTPMSTKYNENIKYQTLKIAIIDCLLNNPTNIPESIFQKIKSHFKNECYQNKMKNIFSNIINEKYKLLNEKYELLKNIV